MDILGNGMIARAFAPYASEFADTVVSACGVPASSKINQTAKARELMALYAALNKVKDSKRLLVYFSSGAVYGNAASMPWKEDILLAPFTEYGQHKLVCETLIRNANIPHLIVRLGNLVGDGQNPVQLIPTLVKQIKLGNATVQLRATRDLLDVVDMAHIVVDLLRTQTERGETLNVASSQSVPVARIAAEISLLLQQRVTFNTVDTGDEQRFDISRLKERLPRALWFDSGYYRRVIEKYVHAEVAEPS